ncbi:Proteinase inhibitor, propeptide [Ascosphaera apis ARSEF 7405]|uniref:Proteinase inhibitor, propeptide n=1 Tax=Ascosphaera apis ARSEF 7405 TaxID=392613 RepID=A0A167VA96_9EURO|nr:Proteinase inhibitor, propeptide [Ascosphaera apis ARSEF 7405]
MQYNVTLKPDAPKEELEKAKEEAKAKGGVIAHEFTLIKGFVVQFPDDHVDVLESNDHLHVEKDQEVKTQ